MSLPLLSALFPAPRIPLVFLCTAVLGRHSPSRTVDDHALRVQNGMGSLLSLMALLLIAAGAEIGWDVVLFDAILKTLGIAEICMVLAFYHFLQKKIAR